MALEKTDFKIKVLKAYLNGSLSKEEAKEILSRNFAIPMHYHLWDDSILSESEINHRNGLLKLGVLKRIEWV